MFFYVLVEDIYSKLINNIHMDQSVTIQLPSVFDMGCKFVTKCENPLGESMEFYKNPWIHCHMTCIKYRNIFHLDTCNFADENL